MDMAEPLEGLKSRSVLRASGHIAGAVNPQAKDKCSYQIDGTSGNHAETRLTIAKALAGSRWSHWLQWLKPRLGKSVPAREARQNQAQPAGGWSGAPCERERQPHSRKLRPGQPVSERRTAEPDARIEDAPGSLMPATVRQCLRQADDPIVAEGRPTIDRRRR